MGFGADLQGKNSHEALLRIQDAEIKLLENIRRCMQLRMDNDKKYSAGLHQFVLQAQKINPDPSNEFTPLCTVFKVWDVIVRETEQLSQFFVASADELCTKTLEKLNSLINEKKMSRKFYNDERNRLEAEFTRIQEDLVRTKVEYHKVMEKLRLDKTKFEDLYRRPGKNVKLEEAKAKYLRTTVKLHRLHNDYVVGLKEVTSHQEEYLNKNLPSLLDYHQNTQHILVEQCKDILTDFSRVTHLGSPQYLELYTAIQEAVLGITPDEEYNQFIQEHRSDAATALPVEFDEKLLDHYQGSLQVNEIACDDLTLETLKHRRATKDDLIREQKLLLNEKEKELNTIVQELDDVRNRLIQEDEERTKNDYFVKRRAMEILRRELTEKESELRKQKLLLDIIDKPLTELGDKTPPPGLELPDINGESCADISASSSGSSGFSAIKNKVLAGLRKQSSPSLSPLPRKEDFVHVHKSNSQGNLPNSYDSVGQPSNGVGGPQFTVMDDFVPKNVEDEQWFHGILPREEVIRLLQKDGDFIVRESKNRKTNEIQYVLSVFWGQPKHFIIQNCQGGWRFEGQIFPTMSELIHYQLTSGKPVTEKSQALLSNPVLKEDWELRNDDIDLQQKIGNGNFGEVFKGLFKPTGKIVAVKTCKDTLKEDQRRKFLAEGRILKEYNHPNIVEFIGIAAQRQPVMIVMEFCSGGALLGFLRKQGKTQTKRALAMMCKDASSGMAYLEDKGCIHRDLAARNCLIAKQNVVKIADFGMSREEELYTVSEGMKQIPIKWTAPEALNYGTYTSLCDVWSYGILMWEVFSGGTTPYLGMSNSNARDEIEKGYRMPPAEGTPDSIYQLMLGCWEYQPEKRPHFKDIYEELTKHVASL